MSEVIYAPPVEDGALQSTEARTQSGIVLPSFSALYGDLRAWIKIRGEGAIVLYCTPDAFRQTWREYKQLNDRRAVIAACDHLYGLPMFFFYEVLRELVYIGITHQPKERAKPAPGGVWYPGHKWPAAGVWIER